MGLVALLVVAVTWQVVVEVVVVALLSVRGVVGVEAEVEIVLLPWWCEVLG